MENSRLKELFEAYLDNRILAEEVLKLQEFLNDPDQEAQLSGLLTAAFKREAYAAENEQAKSAVYQHVSQSIHVAQALESKRRAFVRYRRILTAAAAIAVMITGVYFLYRSPSVTQDVRMTQDIAPGKNTATLTLANGKIIALDTNKTIVTVADSVKTMTMLTAATPRGGTYQLVLSDGTRVWLNADSKISFPSQFAGLQRRISVVGEVYLEVAKDRQHPFIVESRNQVIEVLGTHFNVSSYEDEGGVKTTLLEGSVRVKSGAGGSREGSAVVLKPNQQSLAGEKGLIVRNVDPEEAMAWKNGMIMFQEEGLVSIMRRVARWYDVEIVYQDDVSDQYFGGALYRTKNLSTMLNFFSKTGEVRFEVEGRRVIVRRK